MQVQVGENTMVENNFTTTWGHKPQEKWGENTR
jgi:hypothetical protein